MRTPGDDPQGNGRAEVAIQAVTRQVRAALHQSGKGSLEERSVDGAVHGEGSVHLPGVGSPWALGDEGGWHEGGDEIRHQEADGARY